MTVYQKFFGCLLTFSLLAACHNNPAPATATSPAGSDSSGIREETIAFPADSVDIHAFVVYNDSVKGRRPAILVLPEWWGMNDYPKMRARMLAKLGYVAMAVDVYGGGRVTENPDTAGVWAATLYRHPERAKARIDAAIDRLKTYDNVDTSKIGAIGYCFGGGVLLNTVRLGDDLKGVVSFHGTLLGTPARKGVLRTKILVCHGNADKFVTPAMVAEFKKQMDSIGADYTFVGYDSATHAFTNPASTATGQKYHMPIAYNGKADTASWEAMKGFFAGLFK
ncbi:MAG TPA: dienelactone hydrolase family protein [Puia sp.]|jgi:dienelactone hydrolase|nr:dienelactone hydrolase family protein [Puia sp.]